MMNKISIVDINTLTIAIVGILFFQLSQNIVLYQFTDIYIKNWYFSIIYLLIIILSEKKYLLSKIEICWITIFLIVYSATMNASNILAIKNFFIWILPAIIGYIIFKTKTPKLNLTLIILSAGVFLYLLIATIFIFFELPNYTFKYSNGVTYKLYNTAPYYDYLVEINSIRYTYPNIEHGYFGSMLFIPLVFLSINRNNNKLRNLINQSILIILFIWFYIIGSRAVFYGLLVYLMFMLFFKIAIFKKLIIPFVIATIISGTINPAYILRYASPLYPYIAKTTPSPTFEKIYPQTLIEKIKRHDDSHYHTSYFSYKEEEYLDKDYRPHGLIPNLILEIGIVSTVFYLFTLIFIFARLVVVNYKKLSVSNEYIIGIALFFAMLLKILGNQNDGNYIFPIIFSISFSLINSKE